MKKYYTLTEYCRRFSLDRPTEKKICKLNLNQSRLAGGNGITRGSRKPLEFWKELHSKVEETRRIPTLFFSVPCYIRKTPAMEGVDTRAFYSFMKKNYKSFKSKLRRGTACDDLLFLIDDLRAGATQFLNKSERHAPQKRQEAPSAPDPVNTCSISGNTTHGGLYVTVPEKGPSMAFPLAFGFFLGLVVAASVVILNVYC